MSDVLERYVEAYHSQLYGSPAWRFLRRRGIGSLAAEGFRLGYVGKTAARSHQQFAGCLVIPYLTGLGAVRTLRFRRLDDQYPKYLSFRNDDRHVFGVRMTDNPRVFVTEGELDAMTIWQLDHDRMNVVAIPGAKMWRREWAYLFRNCDEVVLAIDNDGRWDEKEARGQGGQYLAAKMWRDLERLTAVRRVPLPRGQDVNDVYLERGPYGLMKLLEAA